MRSPLPYLFASTSVLLLSLVPAIAPALAEEGFTPAHRYPKVVIEGFMQGCIAKQGIINPKLIVPLCYCAVQAVQDKYSLEQMLALSREMRVTRTTPPELQEISRGCTMAVLKATSNR
jgi:hypothetical protein